MTSAPPSLSELQRWLAWVIAEPRGVSRALAGAGAPAPGSVWATEPSPRAIGAIAEKPPLSRVSRLDVYAEGYFKRLADCLGSDFPAVHGVLGEVGFVKLAARYLDQLPSRSTTVAELGRHLADFLQTDSQAEPFLADLARLEWLCQESFYSPCAAPLDPAAWSRIPPESWPSLQVRLSPTVRLLRSDWPVDHARKTQAAPSRRRRTHLLVHRPEFEVEVTKLNSAEFELLQAFMDGQGLGEACARLERLPRVDLARVGTKLGAWFSRWVRAGVISELQS